MLAVKGTSAQNVEAVRVIIVLLAVAVVIHWRTVLKIAIFILAAAVIVLLGTGAYALLQHAPHAIK